MPPKRRYLERFAVLVVIVATHVLFLELFFRNGRHHIRRSVADVERGELFFVDVPPPEQKQPSVSVPRSAAARRAPDSDASTAITLPEEEPPARSIDWYGDAGRIARERLDESSEPEPRAFGDQPKSPYNKRSKRKPGYEWRPEERKAGFVGPIPYLRIGKRCIIVPPLFGCAIGKLPRPRGATLDEMRDARGSVSEVDE